VRRRLVGAGGVTPRPVPFHIDIPEAELDDLRARLRNTRWPADPGNPDGRYGARQEWVAELVTYWAESYDWRAVEAEMNRGEQFVVELDGIPIHYQRVRGTGPDPMPLILSHGWPWTFWDYRKVVDALADPAAHGGDASDSFDVIVPSLPGFGFSVPLTTTGVDVPRVAELWKKLMVDVLGYDRFGAGGGDFGAIVTSYLGHAHAEHLAGIYLTMAQLPGLPFATRPEEFAADEQWMPERARAVYRTTEAHVTVNRRDPQTFAYAMADSPAGLGAWLWHRREDWCDGDAIEVFGRDDLCTLSSLYWFNSSFASSIRLYAEQFTKPWALVHDRERIVDAPTGVGVFAKDLVFMPRAVMDRRTDLRRWQTFDQGGHFAPAEQPEIVVDELRAFFRDLR
jgi:pimeloyl-ACP methyl ester carboxylesterase